jgi:hypothetical protein
MPLAFGLFPFSLVPGLTMLFSATALLVICAENLVKGTNRRLAFSLLVLLLLFLAPLFSSALPKCFKLDSGTESTPPFLLLNCAKSPAFVPTLYHSMDVCPALRNGRYGMKPSTAQLGILW